MHSHNNSSHPADQQQLVYFAKNHVISELQSFFDESVFSPSAFPLEDSFFDKHNITFDDEEIAEVYDLYRLCQRILLWRMYPNDPNSWWNSEYSTQYRIVDLQAMQELVEKIQTRAAKENEEKSTTIGEGKEILENFKQALTNNFSTTHTDSESNQLTKSELEDIFFRFLKRQKELVLLQKLKSLLEKKGYSDALKVSASQANVYNFQNISRNFILKITGDEQEDIQILRDTPDLHFGKQENKIYFILSYDEQYITSQQRSSSSSINLQAISFIFDAQDSNTSSSCSYKLLGISTQDPIIIKSLTGQGDGMTLKEAVEKKIEKLEERDEQAQEQKPQSADAQDQEENVLWEDDVIGNTLYSWNKAFFYDVNGKIKSENDKLKVFFGFYHKPNKEEDYYNLKLVGYYLAVLPRFILNILKFFTDAVPAFLKASITFAMEELNSRVYGSGSSLRAAIGILGLVLLTILWSSVKLIECALSPGESARKAYEYGKKTSRGKIHWGIFCAAINVTASLAMITTILVFAWPILVPKLPAFATAAVDWVTKLPGISHVGTGIANLISGMGLKTAMMEASASLAVAWTSVVVGMNLAWEGAKKAWNSVCKPKNVESSSSNNKYKHDIISDSDSEDEEEYTDKSLSSTSQVISTLNIANNQNQSLGSSTNSIVEEVVNHNNSNLSNNTTRLSQHSDVNNKELFVFEGVDGQMHGIGKNGDEFIQLPSSNIK